MSHFHGLRYTIYGFQIFLTDNEVFPQLRLIALIRLRKSSIRNDVSIRPRRASDETEHRHAASPANEFLRWLRRLQSRVSSLLPARHDIAAGYIHPLAPSSRSNLVSVSILELLTIDDENTKLQGYILTITEDFWRKINNSFTEKSMILTEMSGEAV